MFEFLIYEVTGRSQLLREFLFKYKFIISNYALSALKIL